jgi:hypothetical protein
MCSELNTDSRIINEKKNIDLIEYDMYVYTITREKVVDLLHFLCEEKEGYYKKIRSSEITKHLVSLEGESATTVAMLL